MPRITPAILAAVTVNWAAACLPAVLAGVPIARAFSIHACLTLGLYSVWIVAEGRAGERRRSAAGGAIPGPRGLDWMSAPVMLLILMAAVTEAAFRPAASAAGGLSGAACLAAGVRMRVVAIGELGDGFRDAVDLGPGHTLSTTGLYARMRHPSELGSLLISAGTWLCLGSRFAAVLWAGLLVPLVVRRARREDRLLMRHFPDAFVRYSAEVPAWVPRLSGLPRPLIAGRDTAGRLRPRW